MNPRELKKRLHLLDVLSGVFKVFAMGLGGLCHYRDEEERSSMISP